MTKNLEKARFATQTPDQCGIFFEKVAVSRPSARLGASTDITKKARHPTPCYGKFYAVWSFFWAAALKKCWKRPVLPIRRVLLLTTSKDF
jgi:hypothetical protein